MAYRRATNSALTETMVARIKAQLISGTHTTKQLAQVHSLAVETIRRIARGETWAWVEADETARDVVERTEKELDIELRPRDDAAAKASFERFQALMKGGGGPVLPVAKGTADRAAMFGAHRQTVEQMNQGEIKGDSDNERSGSNE